MGLLAVNIVVGLLQAFFLGPAWRIVEWDVTRRLTRLLGPASRYDVRLAASWVDLISGTVASQIVHGSDVRLRDGLVVSTLEVSIQGLGVSGSSIKRLDAVRYRATITEASLNAYLSARPHRSRLEPTVRLTFTPGHVQVGGDIRVMGVPVPLAAVGKLEVRQGTQLWVVIDAARVALVPLPGPKRPIEFIVYDLSVLPFGLHLDELRLFDARVEIAGRASPTLPLSLRDIEASPMPVP